MNSLIICYIIISFLLFILNSERGCAKMICANGLLMALVSTFLLLTSILSIAEYMYHGVFEELQSMKARQYGLYYYPLNILFLFLMALPLMNFFKIHRNNHVLQTFIFSLATTAVLAEYLYNGPWFYFPIRGFSSGIEPGWHTTVGPNMHSLDLILLVLVEMMIVYFLSKTNLANNSNILR